MKYRNAYFNLCKISLLMLLIITNLIDVKSQSQTPMDEDKRKIRSKDYIPQIQKQIKDNRPRAAKRIPERLIELYNAKNPEEFIVENGVKVGITFWGLKDAVAEDVPAVKESKPRITVIKSGSVEKKQEQTVVVTPRRLNIGTEFANGDWLRFSLESSISGYVYIINREQYQDKSFSQPYLIYPRQVDKDKSDKALSGKLLFIPNQIDYFEIDSLSSIEESKTKTAEVYYIIITPKPLPNLPLLETNQPRKIDQEQFDEYQKWQAKVGIFESYSEVGKAITPTEKMAGTECIGVMTENDPLPQTVYHIARKPGEPIFFTVVVQIKR